MAGDGRFRVYQGSAGWLEWLKAVRNVIGVPKPGLNDYGKSQSFLSLVAVWASYAFGIKLCVYPELYTIYPYVPCLFRSCV